MNGFQPFAGETPIDDLSGLKNKSVKTRSDLNAAEARNIAMPIIKYLGVKPSRKIAAFDYNWMLKLHREMFGDVWEWAGQTRTTAVNLGHPPLRIQEALYALADDLTVWHEFNWDIFEQAATLHHRAVQIHPFLNGNGRWSRLLANILLKQHGAPITLWPDTTIQTESEIRSEYLTALRQADNGKMKPLIQLHHSYAEVKP